MELIKSSNYYNELNLDLKIDTLKEKSDKIANKISTLIANKMKNFTDVVLKINQKEKDYEFVKSNFEKVSNECAKILDLPQNESSLHKMIYTIKMYKEIKDTDAFLRNFDVILKNLSENEYNIVKFKESELIEDFIEISAAIKNEEALIKYIQNQITLDLVEDISKK